MLKIKRIICLLSFIFLFSTYNISIITPFKALTTDVVEDKSIEMIHKDKTDLNGNPTEMQYEKMKQKELAKEKDEKTNEPEWKEFILTFYTSLESENSSAGAVTCQNKPLSRGGVANNVIPQNTNIYLEGYGQVIVNDKGSNKYFGVDNRLDVFIEREPGESNKHYSQRISSYGVQKVQGYIVK
ncbi:3D domain-containing protein [Clostridium uliginosum]|uniref:3D (Asp-Asp-Asp) domain-containing protein n=1 Tax=Clostridium uliginosum TaxID=119641 RepID=A0A1I1JNA2_9CLOT|nr:3D domain-containing protein [Clostridium uliginosum]SFC50024.1 3D (Asp-Asp-Asp) domain-containing protein [Clostridium uliginosum]